MGLPLSEQIQAVPSAGTREKIARGNDLSEATRETTRLWAHCDDLLWDEDAQNAVMVGYGAIQVLKEALSETHFGCDNVNDESTDFDFEPYDHDSSFFAASAYSHGAPWESSSDQQKRLEFCTWWAARDAAND